MIHFPNKRHRHYNGGAIVANREQTPPYPKTQNKRYTAEEIATAWLFFRIFVVSKDFMLKYHLLCFLFLLPMGISAQQKALLHGMVSDANGKPMEFANIAVVNQSRAIGTVTNGKGEFRLEVPANKMLQICASYINYKNDTLTVQLAANERRKHDFMLLPSGTLLPAVTIEDYSQRHTGTIQVPTQNMHLMTGPVLGVETLIKTLEGVSSQNELSSQYSVRGGNFDENLIYVNGIEIFRPFLIRSGQQEGLSFVNTDMVSEVAFSSGGFEPIYGDKMSSVLNIHYRKPRETFGGSASISLLGQNAHAAGIVGSRFTYQIGLRHKTNKYLFNAMDTKGDYNPSFTDLQTCLTYDINERTELSFLGNMAYNQYRFTPSSRETEFGSFMQPLRVRIYFNGEETDVFRTLFGALMLSHRPKDNLFWKFIGSAFLTSESERFDIRSEYYLYETSTDKDGEKEIFDRGIGTFLEHARNRLRSSILNLEHKGIFDLEPHAISWGVKYQYEEVLDRLNEWRMIDSAGSTVSTPPDIVGAINPPHPPLLMQVIKTQNHIQNHRISAFVQDQWQFGNENHQWILTAGMRAQYATWTQDLLFSPRSVLAFKPLAWQRNIVFRFSAGFYSQPAFYREFRDRNGILNQNIKAQKSFHVVLAEDLNFRMNDRPFKFTTAVYYKHLWDIIPYEVDNIRLVYSAQNNAVGYAAGIDARLSGEFIEGIDSWASLSLMTVREDIQGDGHGYIPRPTDHLFNASVYFQDYIPKLPHLKVNLNFSFSTGVPFGTPNSMRWQQTQRMRPYMRADIGLSWKIKDEQSAWAKRNVMKYIKRIWLSGEVFNLFDNRNVNSYLWVADSEGYYYGVPNYLTPRQLNCRLIFEF